MESKKYFRMMVPTSGMFAAKKNAKYIINMAKTMNADVVVVHIRDKDESREGGDQALDIFDRTAEEMGLTITKIPAIGEISQTIVELAKFHEVDLIVMGATRGRNVSQWIIDTIIKKTDIPVVLIPWDYEVSQTPDVDIQKITG